MKRPYRKAVKDIIMRNVDRCYTYNWSMSSYEKGTSPAYVHYTNLYDVEGYGAWKPEVRQRLMYIEPSAKPQDKGLLYRQPADVAGNMAVHVSEYADFYVCSFDEAKQIAAEMYATHS